MRKGFIGILLSLCGIYFLKTSMLGVLVLIAGIYLIWVQEGEL